jgi:copper chaperone CopZ
MFRTMVFVLVLLISLGARAEGGTTIRLTVDGLVCAFCAQGIEQTLRRQAATEDVFVSLERRLVAVATKPGQDIPDASLHKALRDAGYTIRAIERVEVPLAAIRGER